MRYDEFVERKRHSGGLFGFSPKFIPESLLSFQKHLVEWSLEKGRAAIFADCGLGKTAIQLTWAKNVTMHTGKPVLVLTPIAVGSQTVKEGEKFGIESAISRDGSVKSDITVTNYQKLHLFNRDDFSGVVCDESSILKNPDGKIKGAVIEFMKKTPYRLLCTATAAPNDYIEFGNSSEALGDLGFVDMLGKFFKKAESTTSRSDEFRAGVYRFRGHSEEWFWRWICSWARAIRKPSDIGFDDGDFILPEMEMIEHVIESKRDGLMFGTAKTLSEQRKERRDTITERCEKAASLAMSHSDPVVMWCHLRDEGKLMEKLVPGSVEVDGDDDDEFKEEAFDAFRDGNVRVIISKPTIAGFGLNWQHCAHQTFFPSHSFEQYYQAVRRSWRFGQKKKVRVDMVTSEGELGVIDNLKRKAANSDAMFEKLVGLINGGVKMEFKNRHTNNQEIPKWLS